MDSPVNFTEAYNWSYDKAKLQKRPAFEHSLTSICAYRRTTYSHSYTCSVKYRRERAHKHTCIRVSSGNNNSRNIHNHHAIHAHDTHSAVIFFPIQSLDAHRDSSRFILLFPPPSYIHSLSLSASRSLSLASRVYKCACVFFFVRSSILSLFT